MMADALRELQHLRHILAFVELRVLKEGRERVPRCPAILELRRLEILISL